MTPRSSGSSTPRSLRRADQPGPLWLGHRVFAVDGSKLNLPRPLAAAGYDPPGPHAHYPQGLLSCLLRLQSRLPVDFDLFAHRNERAAARAHLRALAAPDLVVYDRGYYSFELLWSHRRRRLQAVFRLPRNICPAIDAFIDGDGTDTLVTILPGPATLRTLSRKYPGTHWQPLPLRLVKYTHATTKYVLGTTLLDSRRYSVADLSDLYHARWGIEEMYKISKSFLEVQQFHGQSERLVQQELCAHFNLIAMMRLFTNRDADLCQAARQPDGKAAPQANFKHSLAALSQHLEGLLLAPLRVCRRDPGTHLRVWSGRVGASRVPTARTSGARCSRPRNGPGARRRQPSCFDANPDAHDLSARNLQNGLPSGPSPLS